MSMKIVSPESDVISFLFELKEALNNTKFNVATDLDILLCKSNESPMDPNTTVNTLLALGFDRHDVMAQLLELEKSDYMETFIDDRNTTLPPFFAFGRSIKQRDVYIKLKIRDRLKCKIFCVSFHFARYPLPTKRPYI